MSPLRREDAPVVVMVVMSTHTEAMLAVLTTRHEMSSVDLMVPTFFPIVVFGVKLLASDKSTTLSSVCCFSWSQMRLTFEWSHWGR